VGQKIAVDVTPSDDDPGDDTPNESTALAAGHAEATAENAAETAEDAAEASEVAAIVANDASETAYASLDRVSNLETIVTGMVAQQEQTNAAIAQLVEAMQLQNQLVQETTKPDPEPVTPDTVPNPGGWYHKPLFRK